MQVRQDGTRLQCDRTKVGQQKLSRPGADRMTVDVSLAPVGVLDIRNGYLVTYRPHLVIDVHEVFQRI